VKVRGALREWITIAPGDMIVGDADGIIAIPAAMIGQVAAAAGTLSDTESDARREIAQGLPLLAALDRYGRL
jgi:4-hydroxy-4-methyl-2-oxoglutarate aldolase